MTPRVLAVDALRKAPEREKPNHGPLDRRPTRIGERVMCLQHETADRASLTAEIDRLSVALATAQVALDTAEARERSRIAEDLHDILGHALQIVAFKAELAARLMGADSFKAHGELVEIQRVSRSAMSDVRGLVGRRRPTDLAAQLDSAIALFDSAEVQVIVVGDVGSLAGCARDPLARVLREAVTNVLRHAEPTRCVITLQQGVGDATVTVVNNGVQPRAAVSSREGTGLAGLGRLLADLGGRLDVWRETADSFTVRATVATLAPANRPEAMVQVPPTSSAASR